ncbi:MULTISPECIES: 2,3-diaminopropionate biosynthesis protein SbnA [unclassified Microbulbifer]|uniref:2,3-diaminopropionate biosynthesis protein SbnA n=1 Tax=unclassified Microbulbifer TaxID=2619833 RepID=UPI0027E52278|nr:MULTISPECIES: 2,3-diaminopropionate biosynthesis protein SbnA [unclassified Microbulbifer]
MVHESIASCIGNTPLVSLSRLFRDSGVSVNAKLELLNPGGSVKDRPAKYIIEQGLRDGSIPRGGHLIESTSGNLGVALAMLCRVYGLELTCVVDPNVSRTNLQIMRCFGARVDMVREKDSEGGYLETRIRRVKTLLETLPGGVWVNQYANVRNWHSHYHGEGTELIGQLPEAPDYLVAGVSTSGTILGISRRLRERFPGLQVIGVDALGSVLFGRSEGRRRLPGIGASRVPELLVREEIDDVIYVSDLESCQGCLDLLDSEGIFAGGSSGSVVAAIRKLIPRVPRGSRILTLLPDRGDRYLDLVYSAEWRAGLEERYRPPEVSAGATARETVIV